MRLKAEIIEADSEMKLYCAGGEKAIENLVLFCKEGKKVSFGLLTERMKAEHVYGFAKGCSDSGRKLAEEVNTALGDFLIDASDFDEAIFLTDPKGTADALKLSTQEILELIESPSSWEKRGFEIDREAMKKAFGRRLEQ